MTRGEQPDRLVVDEHEFTVTKAVLTMTPLPWGELSLDLAVDGSSDGPWRTCCPSLYDVRVLGRSRRDLDGCVVEAREGWTDDPDPDFPRAVIDHYALYVDGHFPLVKNRLVLRCLDDDHVQVSWTAATETHIDEYGRNDLRSGLTVDLRAVVRDGEYQRLQWKRTEGTDEKDVDLAGESHRLTMPWLEERGRAMSREHWFQGRSFERIDFVVAYGKHLSAGSAPRWQTQIRPDRVLRVRVPMSIALLRTRPSSEVAGLLMQQFDDALVAAAAAHPSAPRFLR